MFQPVTHDHLHGAHEFGEDNSIEPAETEAVCVTERGYSKE
jgi:hypothetical protein